MMDQDEEKAQPLIEQNDDVLPNNTSNQLLHGSSEKLSVSDSSEVICNEKHLMINICRDAVEMKDLDKKAAEKVPPWHSMKIKVVRKLSSSCICSLSCLATILKSLFPIMMWLPQYKVKKYLINDIVAGITVSVLHIPQGMAYGMLASVEAVNGLYVSFFPVFIYLLMGTSQHMSIGTFAAVSLMVSGVTERWDDNKEVNKLGYGGNSSAENITFTLVDSYSPTTLEIATALCITVGLCQLLMGFLRLGFLAVLLSDQLVSGFSTGAAMHVATVQIIELLSVPVHRHSGPLKIVYMYAQMFSNIGSLNPATVMMSVVAISILVVSKECLSEPFQRKLKIPLPIDVIMLIVATTVSATIKLNENYDVHVIGAIPTGLPAPVPPRPELFPALILDAVALSMVTFAVTMSLGKILSKRQKCSIRANQELLALGSANVFSSFFACYPCSPSLSRSLIQERTGGKTQLSSLVSSILILVVLLALGPLLYHLPKCILSAIILVALKELFLQVKDFWYYCKVSITDALIWLVTFLSVVLWDLGAGLLVGIVFSILTIVGRSLVPHRAVLGSIPHTEIYLDQRQSDQAEDVPGVKIFHFGAGVYFGNKEVFRKALHKVVFSDKNSKNPVNFLIIDCSAITYIDASGLDTLIDEIEAFKVKGVTVSLASCSGPVWKVLKQQKFQRKVPHVCVYPTIHDAVVHSKQDSCAADRAD